MDMGSVFTFFKSTALWHFSFGQIVMIAIGAFFIGLGIVKRYEPLLLIPIGFGMIMGNIPLSSAALDEPEGVMHFLYFGIQYEIYPPLIFLGIGAMTDFSFMISQPRLILLGAAAQFGVFLTFLSYIFIYRSHDLLTLFKEAGSIGIIGGADGPTAIFLSSKLAPHLLAPIALSAYSYMAMVPIIQPPIIRLLTTKKERMIRMRPPKDVSSLERKIFPVVAFVLCTLLAPKAAILLGMLFLGNLLRESGVTDRLARTASGAFVDIVTILLGICVGAAAKAELFLQPKSLLIFALGLLAFTFATASGVLFAKLMNLLSRDPVNPMIGASGVSAVPMSARVVQTMAQRYDPDNFLLMQAMAPNVAGVIGTALAAGVLLALLGG